jgi:hypothetical protein
MIGIVILETLTVVTLYAILITLLRLCSGPDSYTKFLLCSGSVARTPLDPPKVPYLPYPGLGRAR